MRKLTLLLALVLVSALAGAARADSPEPRPDNAAVAIVQRDGDARYDVAFSVDRERGDVVDNYNQALAFASCTDCEANAVAVEIVLLTGSPRVFTPRNEAIALNYQCERCESFASAYQFVVQSDGRLEFTDEGRRELKDIRRAIRDLDYRALDPPGMQAQLDPLIERLRTVLAGELRTRDHGHGREPDDVDAERDTDWEG